MSRHNSPVAAAIAALIEAGSRTTGCGVNSIDGAATREPTSTVSRVVGGPIMVTKPTLTQEFNGSQHRLLENGKPVTPWAGWTQIVTYKGYVGHTAYYGNKEGVCTAREFVEMIAVQGVPE